MPRLTKRFIDTLKLDDLDGGERTYWDDEIKGFGLRVWPSGRKVYIFKYRVGGGRAGLIRKPAIGQHGSLTPDEARRIAKDWAAIVAAGGDPSGQRQEQRATPTVAELAELYLERHARPHKKPRSVAEDERHLRHYVLPAFGTKKAADISVKHVTELHHKLSGKPITANRVLALLSKMFSLAEAWNIRPQQNNPCRHVQKYPERALERFLSPEELARLGQALDDAAENGTETASAITAIRLLMFTGCRMREITELTRDEVDLAGKCLRLKDSKTGAKKVHLPETACEILRNIPRLPDNPYVITGRRAGAHLTDLEKPWQRIRKAAGLEDVRLHDLRHTFASLAVAEGMSLPVLAKLMGHSQISTTQRYAHLADDPLQQASQMIGQRLNAAIASTRTASGSGSGAA